MMRLPVDKVPVSEYRDKDVKQSWKWFMSFISPASWQRRRTVIENRLDVRFKDNEQSSKSLTDGTLIAMKDDVIGWYLYLVDVLINEPHKYEYFQGARVIPLFKRMGANLEILKSINGIDKRVKDLLKKRRNEADALLFEILTALLWTMNGYEVTFIDEANNKTPDLIARKDGREWQIECKRQSKTSNYTYKETEKRQKMLSHIRDILIDKGILLDINFHVELVDLPDTFLKDLLSSKINLAIPGKIVSNEQVDIDLTYVVMDRVKNHLAKYYVKHNSPMLNKLIGGKPVDNKAFSCGVLGDFFRVGEGDVNNLYVSDISKAFGVYWNCDAKEALWSKARDIKSQLRKAMNQFDPENTSVVHIGLETFDGPIVENIREDKIGHTIQDIDTSETCLEWVFCHFFQAYSPHDRDWVFDETVSKFPSHSEAESPLNITHLVIPEELDSFEEGAHWNRPLP